MNLPNMLSFFRILLIPFLVLAYYVPASWGHMLAAVIFAVAAMTDWLDGYLARLLKQATPLGAFLDPVADKLIVAAAIVLLLGKGDLAYITLPSIIIVGREIAISALREWMAELGRRASVAVSVLGKVKTVLQMLSIIVLLYLHEGVSPYITGVAYTLYYVAALMTLWSMYIYFKSAWPELKSS